MIKKTENEILQEGLLALSARSNMDKHIADSKYVNTLMEFLRLVLVQNQTLNLTKITEPTEFVRLHLLDSLACVGLPEFSSAEEIIDIGSGAGFPGIPLAALFPEKRFVLADSLRKKVEFIKKATATLGINNTEALHIRAEAAGHDPGLRENFDLALCRAVGKLPLILEYCLPLVRVGGAAVFYKTESAEREIEESLHARKLLGGSELVQFEAYKDLLPDRSHVLYVVAKERKTPKKYPRHEGIPSKTPLQNN